MCRIRTLHTLWSGYQTMSRQLFARFHPWDIEWQEHLSGTQLQSRKFSKGLENNLRQCSEEKPFCIGTQERGWMKWSLLKLSLTCKVSIVTFSRSTKIVFSRYKKICNIFDNPTQFRFSI